MDLKEIEKLMAAMESASIKRVALKREGFEIELEREEAYVCAPPPPKVEMAAPQPVAAAPTTPAPAAAAEGTFVTSPMVGTFYSSPSPDDPPFVKVGDAVDEGSVLCIVEAMKVMNEVKSGMQGRIAEILVKSGDPVEFGTKIFRLET